MGIYGGGHARSDEAKNLCVSPRWRSSGVSYCCRGRQATARFSGCPPALLASSPGNTAQHLQLSTECETVHRLPCVLPAPERTTEMPAFRSQLPRTPAGKMRGTARRPGQPRDEPQSPLKRTSESPPSRFSQRNGRVCVYVCVCVQLEPRLGNVVCCPHLCCCCPNLTAPEFRLEGLPLLAIKVLTPENCSSHPCSVESHACWRSILWRSQPHVLPPCPVRESQ